jgi:predicted nuclease of predicted toxin-antitoxin system
MKWLIDAHLPRRLAYHMRDAGHDVVHTLDLPDGNATSDQEINQVSIDESRIVVTKDADFVLSYWLYQHPYKLLLVATGNITNNTLLAMISQHLPTLSEAFEIHDFIEIDQDFIIIHG